MQTALHSYVLHSLEFDKDNHVDIPAGGVTIQGDLYVPSAVSSLVIFAHGSGSSRHSPRNRYVADVLHEKRIGTLLIDLLTQKEEAIDNRTRELRFDIELLTQRLMAAQKWVISHPALQGLEIGYFGASTGAAAALSAAARDPKHIGAVVSRGGRPDLAGGDLPRVKAPTLLIVGGHDTEVLALNKEALEKLNKESKLDVVPRAAHLFEEPGTLEEAAQLAASWFDKFLPVP